ncbi:hypothetical protein E4U58_006592 [Claviceps cyperi]|nr:hypothetical protein E4U58_006592 [Claviceps cyperi]
MLTSNLRIEKGLVNGSVGTVEDLAWDWFSQIEPHKRPPAVLMVRFDSYTGPPYYKDDPDRATVIPVFRQQSRHIFKGTLSLGLSYVVVSRVKTLDGIMFDVPFDHPSICGKFTPQNDPRRKDAEDRLRHHLPADADDID